MGRCAPACALFLCCLVLAGCAGIGVKPTQSMGLMQAWQVSTVMADQPSARTLQTLRRWDLEDAYQQNPAEAVKRLHAQAVQEPQPDLLFALAETNYLLGKAAERKELPDSCVYYYLCAGYAYHYLLDPLPRKASDEGVDPALVLTGGTSAAETRILLENPYDPRFRLACDLYNNALSKCLRMAQKHGKLDPGKPLQLKTPAGEQFELAVAHHHIDWAPEEIGPWLFCEDYTVNGLANRYCTFGLGVPLIGQRLTSKQRAEGAFYPKDLTFPATAFFRFEGSLADLGRCRSGHLDVYNPAVHQTVTVRERVLPLETNLTTPLAYFLTNTDLGDVWYQGFLKPDEVKKRSGIYMMEPYRPGKIPVLLVHGLLSSPTTWAPMFNDLLGDPYLREHFQFWFYLYPTGDAYFATAADLRHNLNQLRTTIDRERKDAALDHMVCVGHSMGGLVSKLLSVDSNDDFWRLVSTTPFAQLKGQSRSLGELQQVFFFEQQPYVERIVFLGTPHRGSKLSPSRVAQLADKFVHTPMDLMKALQDVTQENPSARLEVNPAKFPTSVDLLAPGASGLMLLASRQPQGVHLHSIIGDAPKDSTLRKVAWWLGETDQRSDGVVPYSSAHLDQVDSELIVTADHTHVHQHPLAVREVRRILLLHLQEQRKSRVVPAHFETPAARLERPVATDPAVARP